MPVPQAAVGLLVVTVRHSGRALPFRLAGPGPGTPAALGGGGPGRAAGCYPGNSPLLHKQPGTGSQVADGIHLVIMIVYGRLGFV